MHPAAAGATPGARRSRRAPPQTAVGSEKVSAACRPSRRHAHPVPVPVLVPVPGGTGGGGARLVDVAGQAAGGEGRVEPGVAAGGVRHVPHRRLHRPRDGACAVTPRHCEPLQIECAAEVDVCVMHGVQQRLSSVLLPHIYAGVVGHMPHIVFLCQTRTSRKSFPRRAIAFRKPSSGALIIAHDHQFSGCAYSESKPCGRDRA